MGKLFNLVAVSVGSGMVLGTGFRALNRKAAQRTSAGKPAAERMDAVLDRVAAVELKLAQLSFAQPQTAPVFESRLEQQEAAVCSPTMEALGAELRIRVAEDIRLSLAEVEGKLEQRLAEAQQQTLDALVEGVQKRVVDRISRLEEEVAGQSAAMEDLRDCSVKTEQSLQRLIDGIDRLVSAQAQPRPVLRFAHTSPDPQGAFG